MLLRTLLKRISSQIAVMNDILSILFTNVLNYYYRITHLYVILIFILFCVYIYIYKIKQLNIYIYCYLIVLKQRKTKLRSEEAIVCEQITIKCSFKGLV